MIINRIITIFKNIKRNTPIEFALIKTQPITP